MGDEISEAASPPAAEHPKRAVRVPRTLPPLPRSTGRRKKRKKKEWTCAWGCGRTVVGVRVGGWVVTLSQSHGLTKKKASECSKQVRRCSGGSGAVPGAKNRKP